jgi:hypothetical protein
MGGKNAQHKKEASLEQPHFREPVGASRHLQAERFCYKFEEVGVHGGLTLDPASWLAASGQFSDFAIGNSIWIDTLRRNPRFYRQKTMKVFWKSVVPAMAFACSLALLQTALTAAEGEKDSPTKAFMKKYHKAPKGEDNVAQKFMKGTATPEEVKGLVAGYQAMTKAKPPQGDEASWKEKTSKLASAAVALQKGQAGAQEQFKQAVDCKACHMAHKPK